MNLGSFGDREDNHCQEDGRAKLAWGETRVFKGFGLFVLSSFLKRDTIPSLYRWADLTLKKPISKVKEITNQSNLIFPNIWTLLLFTA